MNDFFDGKRILVTGHTGFKGAWLCKILVNYGAEVTGFSLEPPTNPNLFSICGIGNHMESIIGDIRDVELLKNTFYYTKPEIAIHLAAQPIVRDSYKDPRYTYETNVMGTVNFLECVRSSKTIRSVLNVTTDKVYQNKEWEWGYRENEHLNGYDPYSNSKSCSELVTQSYKQSFLTDRNVALSTSRAGNVIGGGDFANDRIIPDCIRAAINKEDINVRNPHSIRPYQHVLEPLNAYLMIIKRQYEDISLQGCYNVGPDECDCVTTGFLADSFCRIWGEGLSWISKYVGGPHEANFLKLDCSKIKKTFDWKPRWYIDEALEKTIQWTKAYVNEQDMSYIMDQQISQFLATKNKKISFKERENV